MADEKRGGAVTFWLARTPDGDGSLHYWFRSRERALECARINGCMEPEARTYSDPADIERARRRVRTTSGGKGRPCEIHFEDYEDPDAAGEEPSWDDEGDRTELCCLEYLEAVRPNNVFQGDAYTNLPLYLVDILKYGSSYQRGCYIGTRYNVYNGRGDLLWENRGTWRRSLRGTSEPDGDDLLDRLR